MKFKVQHGLILIMHRGYEFKCAYFVKESCLHNLYSMCLSTSYKWIG